MTPDEAAALQSRRRFLLSGTALLAYPLLPARLLAAEKSASRAEGFALPAPTRRALGESPLVYISPLHRDGRESHCHGEVWFFEDGGDVVIMTARDGWKARALRSGRERARIWVGDFGPVGKAGDRYRAAPSFLAGARIEDDAALFERLMSAYAKRYAQGWGKWGPRFRQGRADGSRSMIRYSPLAA